VNRKADFFLQNESIRIDSHNESNRIDSNRELERSSALSFVCVFALCAAAAAAYYPRVGAAAARNSICTR